MASSIRQTWVEDTAPSKFGGIDMTGSASGTSAGQLSPVTSDTLSGSDIVVFAVCSIDPQSFFVNSVSDSVNGAYTLLGHISDPTNSNQDWVSYHFPNAAPLKAVAASGTGSIAAKVLTITGTPTGTYRVGQVITGTGVPANVRIASLGTGAGGAGTYNLNNAGNTTVSSTTMNAADAINVIYGGGIGSGVVPDYCGILSSEVTGASTSVAGQHVEQVSTAASGGTGTVTTGTHAFGSSSGLMLAIAGNGTATAATYAPGADTTAGFTSQGTFWTWDLGQPDMRYESQSFANPGTVAALFNATAADTFVAMAVFLTDASGSFNLSGQSIASAEGTISPALASGLTGQAIVSSVGTVTRAVSYAVSGQAVTSAEGIAAPAVSYALTGESITSTEGTITASTGGNVTLSLSGQAIASASGTLTPSVATSLTGQSVASSEGSITAQPTYVLSGQSVVSGQGAPSAAVTLGLTGQGITALEGSVTAIAGGDVTRQLTGLSAAFTVGQIMVPSSGAGRPHKRYGVLDGDRLLVFDTRAQADAARVAIAARDAPRPRSARKIKVRPLPPARETVPVPDISMLATQMREAPRFERLIADRDATGLAEMYHLWKQRQADEEAAVTLLHLDRLEREAHRSHALHLIAAVQSYLKRPS